MRLFLIPFLLLSLAGTAPGADLPATIVKVKPSVVGVGTYMALRQQQHKLLGTGFIVAGGRYVVTNSHVVPKNLDEGRRETVAVFFPAKGNKANVRQAKVVKRDAQHDLCLLRFDGTAGRSMRIGNDKDVREGELYAFTGFPILNALGLHPREGELYAFTGFPILNALGLHPVTHRGIVSAVSPIVIPVSSGKHLNRDVLTKLAKPFDVFQLDATAYPGNSGSPLYQIGSGRVVGVINSVFVKKTKEMAITSPSGISYAIPVSHVRNLLRAAGLKY
jgi:S1-C subfamily serine protease